MTPVGSEPTISAGARPKTYALDRAATGTGYLLFTNWYTFKTEILKPESKTPRQN